MKKSLSLRNFPKNIILDRNQILEAQYNCDLESLINVFFIRDTKKMYNYVDTESYFLEALNKSFNISKCKGNCIIVSAEYFNPYEFANGDVNKIEKILRESKIAKFISSQKISTYFLCGSFLFTKDRNNVNLSKHKFNIYNTGNIGFRLCATINMYPLNKLKYYFVAAANLGDEIVRPSEETIIYINDEAKGIRRIGYNKDSDWIPYDCFNSNELNNGQVKHKLIDI